MDTEIDNAVNSLNGKKLIEVIINHQKPMTIFKFDLNCELISYNKSYDPGNEMWMLFNTNKVLSLNNLGEYSIGNVHENSNNLKFDKIQNEIISVTPKNIYNIL